MRDMHWYKYVLHGICNGFVVQTKEAVTCKICLVLLAKEMSQTPMLSIKDIKMTREALCAAQHALTQSQFNGSMVGHWVMNIQRLIDECDRHRPLGVNGKHANLHTDTCGCEDKGPRETWGTVTKLVEEA